jgi:four helix bundle protein
MRYDRFERLPVWQVAMDLAVGIYELTRRPIFDGPGDLKDQLRRAGLSVSNNIAEGFERGSTAELLMYLYIARGSAGEVRSMLRFIQRMSKSSSEVDTTSAVGSLIELSESCSRQIRAWADQLQNSDIKGPRHLTEQSRSVYEQTKRNDEFRERLESAHAQTMDKWLAELEKNRERSDTRDLKSEI